MPLAVGAIAHAALARTGGRARVLARLSTSTYLLAGDEIVWLGPADAVMHPRAILGTMRAGDADVVRIDAAALAPWHPPAPGLDGASLERMREGWRHLVRDVTVSADVPAGAGGFGALLTGAPLAFPLDGARAPAAALARACAHDDASGARAPAEALLGLGGGLTPSGDDYVGGALFARGVLATASLADATGWRRTGGAVVETARVRTHPISVALLDDLVGGGTWAPLHEIMAGLAHGDRAVAAAAARRLVALGHTSGWDLLAGLGAGLGALEA